MSGPLGWPSAERVRIAVAADHHLVAESVRAALLNRGYDAVMVRWPRGGDARPHAAGAALERLEPERAAPRTRRRAGPPPGGAVMLSDLARAEQVEGAQSLIARLRVPWLVLAGTPRGPAWGAVYEAGAQLVVPTTTGLDAVCDLIDELVVGEEPVVISRRQRRDLVRGWRTLARERTALTARLESLTVREEEILQMLHAGVAVGEIARAGEVSVATVRSQVKAILRKLEVNSQIAAVAAYELLQSDLSAADPVLRERPRGSESLTTSEVMVPPSVPAAATT